MKVKAVNVKTKEHRCEGTETWNTILYKPMDRKWWLYVEGVPDGYETEIAYCPFCGEKLEVNS